MSHLMPMRRGYFSFDAEGRPAEWLRFVVFVFDLKREATGWSHRIFRFVPRRNTQPFVLVEAGRRVVPSVEALFDALDAGTGRKPFRAWLISHPDVVGEVLG
jgi:hypothetical protein